MTSHCISLLSQVRLIGQAYNHNLLYRYGLLQQWWIDASDIIYAMKITYTEIIQAFDHQENIIVRPMNAMLTRHLS